MFFPFVHSAVHRPFRKLNGCLFGILLFFLPLLAIAADSGGPLRREYLREKMAVPVRIVLYAESPDLADAAAEAVYRRFDELNGMMSDYDPESEVVRACRESGETGEPVEISDSLYSVLKRAREIGDLTQGAFDISVSPIVKLWRRSRRLERRPPEDYLRRALELVGPDKWELIEIESVPPRYALHVLKKDVRLDLGGIAKGYAIDEGMRLLGEFGIGSALIDAGGDIRVSAPPPEADGWVIGGVSLAKDTQAAYYIPLADAALTTSGDMFQYSEIDGVRYSHIIDPRCGEPLTARSTVSVLAPDAVTADALASGISVLGPNEGVKLADSIPGIETILFTPSAEGGALPQISATGRFLRCRDEIAQKWEENR